MDKTRLSKVSRLLQKELGNYFQLEARTFYHGKMISVTAVRVSPDLSIGRVYVSIFPTDESKALVEVMNQHTGLINRDIAQKIRHQLRKMPTLTFYLDDSLDYVQRIDELLTK